MGTPEINQALLQAISEAVSKELLRDYGTATTSDESESYGLTPDKLNTSYTDFQRQYARDIWWSLIAKYGHTRMLAAGREESIQAIEQQLDMDKQFRPAWLISSKNCPQEHGLVFFTCNCLCHGESGFNSMGPQNRFETVHGTWCCSCSMYEDI